MKRHTDDDLLTRLAAGDLSPLASRLLRRRIRRNPDLRRKWQAMESLWAILRSLWDETPPPHSVWPC